ncbi:MAG: divergent polysaccharide deacetylase family protein [Alphaproteobacteria bacterium]|nr:divergent polysaccharide deacetylase family protein [Alphaproteobacteria bacterium]
MPFFDQKNSFSPFSGEGLIAGKKRAFKVVSVLAAVSFLFMIIGIYISFFRKPSMQTIYYLSQTDPNAQKEALIDPQPPQNKPEDHQMPMESDTRLIEQLEKERENFEQTAEAFREIVEKTTEPETLIQSETSVQPENDALRELQQEQDAENQKKLEEIEKLHQERLELEKQKSADSNTADASSSASEAIKPSEENKKAEDKQSPSPKKETAASEKKLRVTEPGKPIVPLFYQKDDLPHPDLVQTNLIASLPDFGLIKKSASQNIVPLHIIEPLPELRKESHYGKLPIQHKGHSPFSAYQKKLEMPPKGPYIAILFSGLGKRDNATQAAITALPDTVSLSFSPYAEKLKTYIADARRTGHETLLDLPMQQGAFPDTDPGPLGLVSGLPEQENRKRLYKVLGQDVAYIGITATANENFSYSGTQMKPFFEDIVTRGLIYINGTDNPRMPVFKNTLRPDVHIANEFHRAAIRARLEKTRQIALKKGAAFVRIEAVPITLLTTVEWLKSFAPTDQKPVPEVAFVPLSYYVSAQKEKEQ